MAVDPIYFRIPGDKELYERPAAANFASREYDAVFDPFGLTDFGQKYLYLTLDDLVELRTIAIVEPTNPASGDIVYSYVQNSYFDNTTGNFISSYGKEQTVLGALVIQDALSANVIEAEPNSLITFRDLLANLSFEETGKEGRFYVEGPGPGQIVTNLDQSELDFSSYALKVSDNPVDFEFWPTLSIDQITGEFVPSDINLMGSTGLDGFWDAPGATNFDSVVNNADAEMPYDVLTYQSSPNGINLDFMAMTIVDGWGFTDTFTANKFGSFLLSSNDDIVNLTGADLDDKEQYITIADPYGNDFYFGKGVLGTLVLLEDSAGTDFFNFTEIAGNLIVATDAHETWGYGYQAINVDNNLQIGTQNAINLDGFSKFSDVIYGQELALVSIDEFELIL
jgi:hypothetical protein